MNKTMTQLKVDLIDTAINAIYTKTDAQITSYNQGFQMITNLGLELSPEQKTIRLDMYEERDRIGHAREDVIKALKELRGAIIKAGAFN